MFLFIYVTEQLFDRKLILQTQWNVTFLQKKKKKICGIRQDIEAINAICCSHCLESELGTIPCRFNNTVPGQFMSLHVKNYSLAVLFSRQAYGCLYDLIS